MFSNLHGFLSDSSLGRLRTMQDANATDAGKEWFMSSGRAALWLGCGSFVILFLLANPYFAAPLGLFALVLGITALTGRGKNRGTSNPVMGLVGLLIGLFVGSIPLLLLPAQMAIEENNARRAAEQGRELPVEPGQAAPAPR